MVLIIYAICHQFFVTTYNLDITVKPLLQPHRVVLENPMR
jgi:hypothetical protein